MWRRVGGVFMKAFLIALCAACPLFLSGWTSSASAIPAVQPSLQRLVGMNAQLYQMQDYDDAEDDYADEYYHRRYEDEERRKRNRNWRRDFSYQDFCYKCFQQCKYGSCPPYCWGWGDQCGRWKWRGKVR